MFVNPHLFSQKTQMSTSKKQFSQTKYINYQKIPQMNGKKPVIPFPFIFPIQFPLLPFQVQNPNFSNANQNTQKTLQVKKTQKKKTVNSLHINIPQQPSIIHNFYKDSQWNKQQNDFFQSQEADFFGSEIRPHSPCLETNTEFDFDEYMESEFPIIDSPNMSQQDIELNKYLDQKQKEENEFLSFTEEEINQADKHINPLNL